MAKPEKYSHINFKPPSGVRREAEYGLKLRREHGRGGTAVGIARARDLSNGTEVSPSTVRRMKAYFDRHASDQQGEGFNRGDKGWPSNGYIAAKLWGGFQSGYSWAKKVVDQMNAADEKEGRSYSLDTPARSIDGKETAMDNVERRYLATTGAENATEGTLGVEERADPETGERKTYLVGYAAKFRTDSLLLGDFVEQIAPTAFEIVEKGKDLEGRPLETRGLFNHDPNHLIGRYPNTMKLVVDKIGLKYEILLPESRKDLAEMVARGDLKGSSFSFVVAEGGEKWTREGGKSRRLVTKIKSLLDCGPVTYPAYRDSSVAVAKRSYEQFLASEPATAVAEPQKPKIDVAEEMRKCQEFITERRGFCPTGPGGGIDNSCGKGEGKGPADNKPASKQGGGRLSAALKGAAAGAAAGALGGGAIGAVIGATALGFAAYVASGKKTDEALEKAKSDMGISDTKLNVASAAIFGKGKPQSLATQVTEDGVIAIHGNQGSVFISSKAPVFGVKGKSNLHFDPNGGGDEVANDAILAAKSVGVKTVTVQSWTPESDAALKAAGFKSAGPAFSKSEDHDVWVKDLSDKKSKRYDEFLDFYRERRGFCPTGEGGGVDNSCGKGDYAEWSKGDHLDKKKEKDTQEFLDKAREGQLARGGKDGGKADDGGGVQTWSKGEHYPWTAKQVGDKEGYVQGLHPDGSKTEKYAFKDGDTKEAYAKLAAELKSKPKKRAVDPRQVIDDTLRFLKDRR